MSDYNTIFKTYSCLRMDSELFKDIYRWYPYKHFRSKQAALNHIRRYKEKYPQAKLYFKIVKSSIYDSCNDKVVYDESVNI